VEAPDRIVAINDLKLALDDRGPGTGGEAATPLVLLHGFTGGRVDFADVIDDLARERRVVAWDHRGHADSTNTGDPASYTFDQIADDAHTMVDDLGLERFHLLGHSMGGIVAQRYALAHPDRLRSLILMDTAGAAMSGIPQTLLDATVTRGRTEGMEAVAGTMRQMASGMPMPPESRERLLDRLTHKLTNMDVEAFDRLGRELGSYPSMLDRLGAEVTVPVTVIVGEHDTGLRPAADLLHAAVPGSHLEVIPAAGHSPQDDNPTAWLAAVRAHLTRA
jgi:2-succinyl-6-hydroxy-2,4-cyclohexadiene-1-carboxylate synthase